MRLILLALLVVTLAGADPKPQDPVFERKRQVGEATVIEIVNRLGNDMTVTMEFTESENVWSDPPLPQTQTIPGHGSLPLASIYHGPNPWHYRYIFYWNFGNMNARHDDSVVYSLPYQAGTSQKISQGYHGQLSHQGDDEYALDFSHPEGTPVLCAREGQVVHVEERFSRGGFKEYFRNRVNLVRVRHQDGTIAEYDHFRPKGVEVEEGQEVKRGQLLGYSGKTGYVTGPHLHFVVYSAKDGRHRISYPVKFWVEGSPSPLELQESQSYTAPR